MEESETRRSDGGDKATNMMYAVRFNDKNNKQHKKTGQFILNSQIYAQRVPPGKNRCAGIKMHGSQGHKERWRVTAPSENNVNIVSLHSETTRKS